MRCVFVCDMPPQPTWRPLLPLLVCPHRLQLRQAARLLLCHLRSFVHCPTARCLPQLEGWVSLELGCIQDYAVL